jgi:hypothetical protein
MCCSASYCSKRCLALDQLNGHWIHCCGSRYRLTLDFYKYCYKLSESDLPLAGLKIVAKIISEAIHQKDIHSSIHSLIASSIASFLAVYAQGGCEEDRDSFFLSISPDHKEATGARIKEPPLTAMDSNSVMETWLLMRAILLYEKSPLQFFRDSDKGTGAASTSSSLSDSEYGDIAGLFTVDIWAQILCVLSHSLTPFKIDSPLLHHMQQLPSLATFKERESAIYSPQLYTLAQQATDFFIAPTEASIPFGVGCGSDGDVIETERKIARLAQVAQLASAGKVL